MKLELVLFVIGIIMIVAGISNQLSSTCNEGVKLKVVPRNVYDEIIANQDLAEEYYKDMS